MLIAQRPLKGRFAATSSRTGRCRDTATLFNAMLQVSAVFQVIVSVALLALILMHSGRDAGLGGMGFTPASQGGTHIVERNLTRLTVAVATVFFLNSVVLYRLLA
jgi:preprotein translocase subunit SecG